MTYQRDYQTRIFRWKEKDTKEEPFKYYGTFICDGHLIIMDN